MNKTCHRLILGLFLAVFATAVQAQLFRPARPYDGADSIMVPPSNAQLMQPNEGLLFGSLGFGITSVYAHDRKLIDHTYLKIALRRIDGGPEMPIEAFSLNNLPKEYHPSNDGWAGPSVYRLVNNEYRSLYYRSLPAGTYRYVSLDCFFPVQYTITGTCHSDQMPEGIFEIKPGRITYVGAILMQTQFEPGTPLERKHVFGHQDIDHTFEYRDDFHDDLRHLQHVRKDARNLESVDGAAAIAGSQ